MAKQQYPLLLVLILTMLGLNFWSLHVGSGGSSEVAESHSSQRLELLETLDQVMDAERAFHLKNGRYTAILGKAGFAAPADISENFEIRVDEASSDRLLVAAFSEGREGLADRVSVDQDYRVDASFPLPAPREEYLKGLAQRRLQALREKGEGREVLAPDAGIFPGYFHYEVRQDGPDGHANRLFAIGVREPVLGLHLEGEDLGSVAERTTDQATEQVIKSVNWARRLEDTYVAQHLFQGERYPADQKEHWKLRPPAVEAPVLESLGSSGLVVEPLPGSDKN